MDTDSNRKIFVFYKRYLISAKYALFHLPVFLVNMKTKVERKAGRCTWF